MKNKKTISSLTCYLKYHFRNIIDTHTIILLACVTSVVSAQLRPPCSVKNIRTPTMTSHPGYTADVIGSQWLGILQDSGLRWRHLRVTRPLGQAIPATQAVSKVFSTSSWGVEPRTLIQSHFAQPTQLTRLSPGPKSKCAGQLSYAVTVTGRMDFC